MNVNSMIPFDLFVPSSNWLGGVFGYHVRLTRGRSGVRSSPESKKRIIHLIIRGSIVASILACHARDPGSIPGCGGKYFFLPQRAVAEL